MRPIVVLCVRYAATTAGVSINSSEDVTAKAVVYRCVHACTLQEAMGSSCLDGSRMRAVGLHPLLLEPSASASSSYATAATPVNLQIALPMLSKGQE